MKKEVVRIGCGAGFSGDRLEPAILLAEEGNLDYLVLECLAERTVSLAQKRKKKDPNLGYDPLLERRIEGLLPILAQKNIRLITNMGAANPLAGGKKILEIARLQGINISVAVVHGDDVFELISQDEKALESGRPISTYGNLISANAYLGIDAILPALQTNASIIITGRVADPSLFLAPLVHEFEWNTEDSDLMGQGTVIGHLMECAGQITGGYFADPVTKPVPDMDKLGHPIVEVSRTGSAKITKVKGTGGIISKQTAKEQLLYEVINPNGYFTPDVVADFSKVRILESDKNEITVNGGTGQKAPDTLKVSVGYEAGFLGEGEISYAGSHAKERAFSAGEIIEKRIKSLFDEFRVDYIGMSSLHGLALSQSSNPYEVRLRVAGKTFDQSKAALIGEEVEALYTNGPAGGGGARKNITELVGVVSILMDRKKIKPLLTLLNSNPTSHEG
ncbi:acyclic terpene utilization AtuA family protein [Algoriphagus sp.]|uniref:acyclic terpene utilization AtuA family protein n=1 Tax=Algoriphagus sp. TaxID=1872435 RepID=UPI0025DE34B5|nr:acyclic terpene utilization AtuA family protein [Algoriphagus sp.]